MPRVGSREWNRQQNLRRQREQEQVVQASIVVEQAEQVIIEAEPFECRRDVLQLREEIQNKITQIEQLKTNTKEFKKQIKKLKKENELLTTQTNKMFDDYGEVFKELKDSSWITLASNEVHPKYTQTKIINKMDVDYEKVFYGTWWEIDYEKAEETIRSLIKS
jgi:predicted RNase H-like nuclease (RuvC/YqgF family)